MPFKILVITLLLTFFLPSWVHGGEVQWEEPWKSASAGWLAKKEGSEREVSIGQRLVGSLIGFFQKYISPVDGDRCPSYPTCSQYALEVVGKHGFLMGLVMSSDRLIHESDEIQGAPLIFVHGAYRYYDPVENNDFWWDKK
ncbi:MAG: membrane protein insertion efficiency factor YidD [Deltaproteobacteria bacterium]|nr:membrane protein insertion efficiency factor YidD [Deltaproteobacteria bacterium]